MRTLVLSLVLLILPAQLVLAEEAKIPQRDILVGSKLKGGFGMGVASSSGNTKWLTPMDDHFKVDYPKGNDWGAVFVTVGEPKAFPRPFLDLSEYKTLQVDMRGEKGGEKVAIGIKTNTQPDDGTEARKHVTLKGDWQTYSFPLSYFKGGDPKRVYVLIELVFGGPEASTVYFRNVKYLADQK